MRMPDEVILSDRLSLAAINSTAPLQSATECWPVLWASPRITSRMLAPSTAARVVDVALVGICNT